MKIVKLLLTKLKVGKNAIKNNNSAKSKFASPESDAGLFYMEIFAHCKKSHIPNDMFFDSH